MIVGRGRRGSGLDLFRRWKSGRGLANGRATLVVSSSLLVRGAGRGRRRLVVGRVSCGLGVSDVGIGERRRWTVGWS